MEVVDIKTGPLPYLAYKFTNAEQQLIQFKA